MCTYDLILEHGFHKCELGHWFKAGLCTAFAVSFNNLGPFLSERQRKMNWQWYCKGFASVKTLDLQNSKKQNGFRNCSELVILWHLLVVPDIWLCHANQFTNDVACTLYSCTVHPPFFTVWVTISFSCHPYLKSKLQKIQFVVSV